MFWICICVIFVCFVVFNRVYLLSLPLAKQNQFNFGPASINFLFGLCVIFSGILAEEKKSFDFVKRSENTIFDHNRQALVCCYSTCVSRSMQPATANLSQHFEFEKKTNSPYFGAHRATTKNLFKFTHVKSKAINWLEKHRFSIREERGQTRIHTLENIYL